MARLVDQGLSENAGDDEESLPSSITVFRNTEILDVELPLLDVASADRGSTCIERISVRRHPPKNSVMGPKEEIIECSTLICCTKFQCDVDIFTAINEAGLVYDGGIVVNEVSE